MTDAAFDIAADGMAAERSAMDVIAQNLAAAGTPHAVRGTLGNADSAYVPASFSSALDNAITAGDFTDLEMPFASDFGFADASGSAELPPVVAAAALPPASRATATDGDPIGQMIALVAAGRAYDADVAALQAAKQMDVEASDIDKF